MQPGEVGQGETPKGARIIMGFRFCSALQELPNFGAIELSYRPTGGFQPLVKLLNSGPRSRHGLQVLHREGGQIVEAITLAGHTGRPSLPVASGKLGERTTKLVGNVRHREADVL